MPKYASGWPDGWCVLPLPGKQGAGNIKRKAAVEAQARELLAERVAMFGEDWHKGCAIRLPQDIAEAVAREGTDILLLMLDRSRGEA